MKYIVPGFIGIALSWKPDPEVRDRASSAPAGHPCAGPKGQQAKLCSWGNGAAAVFGKAWPEQQWY